MKSMIKKDQKSGDNIGWPYDIPKTETDYRTKDTVEMKGEMKKAKMRR